MLTVTLGLEGSGKRSTRNPFGYEYSVIPPKVDSFSTPRGSVWENAGSASATRVKKMEIFMRTISLPLILRSDITGDMASMKWSPGLESKGSHVYDASSPVQQRCRAFHPAVAGAIRECRAVLVRGALQARFAGHFHRPGAVG